MIRFIKKNQHLIFPVLDIALNGVNYFFHVFTSWYLLPIDYGKLNSLLAIIAILLVTGISFQTYTSKKIAEKKPDHIAKIFSVAKWFCISISAIIILSINIIENITRAGFLSILLVVAIFIVNVFLSIYRGFLQGNKQFFNLNINFYIEVITKIVMIVLLMPHKSEVATVLLTILLGMIMALIHGIYYCKICIKRVSIRNIKTQRTTIKQLLMIFIANFYIYFFTDIDMIMVNYYLPESSGIFAVVLRYCQIIIFVTFSIVTVFIPILSSYKGDKKKFNNGVLKLLGIVLFIGIGALIGYRYIMPITVDIFFGQSYIEAKNYLFLGSLAYFLLVLSFTLINIYIILDKSRYLWILSFFAILIFVLMNIFNDTILNILYVEIFVYGAMVFTLIYYYINMEVDYE